MTMNLIAINVGNTRTQLGAFSEGKVVERAAVNNTDLGELPPIVRRLHEAVCGAGEDVAIYLASVNDPIATRVEQIVGEAMDRKIRRMEADVNIPIGRKLDGGAFVGEDRLLAAAAAYDKFKQAVIVVDAGTAVTVDFVDGEGTFHGGAILPGMRLMLQSLHEHTAQLPGVEPARPAEPIGHNTAQAMLSGAYHGVRGAVRELVEKYAEQYMAYPKIVATGGDAELLFEKYDLIEAIIPELTLCGMAIAHRCAMTESE
jgi:type III pantothenate kinase